MYYKRVSLSVQEPLKKSPCYQCFGVAEMVDARTETAAACWG